MGRPVEIEFAVNIRNQRKELFTCYRFVLLSRVEKWFRKIFRKLKNTNHLVFRKCLGERISNDVYDVVYVKTESFDAANNLLVAREIKLNKTFIESDRIIFSLVPVGGDLLIHGWEFP